MLVKDVRIDNSMAEIMKIFRATRKPPRRGKYRQILPSHFSNLETLLSQAIQYLQYVSVQFTVTTSPLDQCDKVVFFFFLFFFIPKTCYSITFFLEAIKERQTARSYNRFRTLGEERTYLLQPSHLLFTQAR